MKHSIWGLAIGATIFLLACEGAQEGGPTPTPTVNREATPVPTATASPKATPVSTPPATPKPTPTPAPSDLRIGQWVELTSSEECVEVYGNEYGFFPMDAALQNFRLACLANGFVGYLADGPEFSDGRRWWKIAGLGWAPEENLRFHHEGGFPYPPRPDLTEAGLIAYMGEEGDVWLINADGSQPRRLVDIEAAIGSDGAASELAWSPKGDALAVTVGGLQGWHVLVVDLSGAVLATIPNALLPSWSPDGTRLALLAERQERDPRCEFLHETVMAVFDLRMGDVEPVTPRICYFDGPEWSPDGAALLYTRDGNLYLYSFSAQQERLVRSHGQDDWYWTVAWAPDSQRFSAFHALPVRANVWGAYEVLGLEGEEPMAFFERPRAGCGRGAYFADWQTDWTADGRYILYYEPCGEAGFGGVWVADVATGETRRIPVEGAWGGSPSPDGRRVAFTGSGFIWLADIDGSNLTLLAEGWRQAAWQPDP